VSSNKVLTPEEREKVYKAAVAIEDAIAEALPEAPLWAVAQALIMLGVEKYVFLDVDATDFAALVGSYWQIYRSAAEEAAGEILRVLPTNGKVH
jgi:hypothetical protein